MTTPLFCRPRSFKAFQAALPILDTTTGLLRAAVALSMHELPNADHDRTSQQVQEMADRIRQRVHGTQKQALLAHAHAVLFDELGFHGDTEDYYHSRNSYLPAVLATRRGLPITLGLVYKLVLERIGLAVDGVQAPGHFLVAVDVDGAPMLVDPFHGGRSLTREEAFDRIEQTTRRAVPRVERMLPLATHADWIRRMLRNLQNHFAASDRDEDARAMDELMGLLPVESER